MTTMTLGHTVTQCHTTTTDDLKAARRDDSLQVRAHMLRVAIADSLLRVLRLGVLTTTGTSHRPPSTSARHRGTRLPNPFPRLPSPILCPPLRLARPPRLRVPSLDLPYPWDHPRCPSRRRPSRRPSSIVPLAITGALPRFARPQAPSLLRLPMLPRSVLVPSRSSLAPRVPPVVLTPSFRPSLAPGVLS